ncbi:MAG: cysteine desulfurase [Oscillospiraceae bacterium]|nr:cysteine desulfurase [Oscillospiraceae bacterium]
MIYFDNAASAKPCHDAINAFNDCARAHFANPSALHSAGIGAEKIINAAKKTILSKLSHGTNGDLLFTSGGTESNNLALLGLRAKQGKIITTSLEHPSVAEPLTELEKRGFEVIRLSPVQGESFEEKIIAAVDDKVVLISVMAVNNETGFIIDTPKIYTAVKRKFPNVLLHTDAAQGFMKVPVNGDLISLSAHKIHGIKGAGALFLRENVRMNPLFFGGGQQKNLRPGTEPAELISAFGAAVGSFVYEHEYFTKLSEKLKQLLDDLSGVNDIKYNSREHIPSIVNFSVRGIKSEVLLHFFAENGIYISSGSACARGKKSKSLLAFGVSEKDADSALRLSFSSGNTTDEIEKFIEVLKAGIKRFGR